MKTYWIFTVELDFHNKLSRMNIIHLYSHLIDSDGIFFPLRHVMEKYKQEFSNGAHIIFSAQISEEDYQSLLGTVN